VCRRARFALFVAEEADEPLPGYDTEQLALLVDDRHGVRQPRR
jgi:hypothetical protein